MRELAPSADGRTALLADLKRLDAWEIRDPSYPHQVGVDLDPEPGLPDIHGIGQAMRGSA